jgi:hypothetical protein
MQRTFENEYYVVDVDHDARIIEMVRSQEPFRDMPAVLRTLEKFMESIQEAGATRYSLLVDSRSAPYARGGRYKKAFSMLADFLNARFSRIAVVLSNEESALDEAESGSRSHVDFFTSPDAARKALSTPLPRDGHRKTFEG